MSDATPRCPHCAAITFQRTEALGWWFGQDCASCGQRFEVKRGHDRLFDVRTCAKAIAASPVQPQ